MNGSSISVIRTHNLYQILKSVQITGNGAKQAVHSKKYLAFYLTSRLRNYWLTWLYVDKVDPYQRTYLLSVMYWYQKLFY